jgi:hypothetical protein
VSNLKSIREVKIEAVQTEIEALETVHDVKETIDVYAQS